MPVPAKLQKPPQQQQQEQQHRLSPVEQAASNALTPSVAAMMQAAQPGGGKVPAGGQKVSVFKKMGLRKKISGLWDKNQVAAGQGQPAGVEVGQGQIGA